MRQLVLFVLLLGILKLFLCSPPHHCRDGDYYPEPSDCSVFYQCDHGAPVKKRCGPGTVFNANTLVCDWPYNVHCQVEKKISCYETNQGEDEHW